MSEMDKYTTGDILANFISYYGVREYLEFYGTLVQNVNKIRSNKRGNLSNGFVE